jgi:hypothetical protein
VGIFQYNPCTDLSVEWEVVEYHGTDEGDLTGLGEQDLLLISKFTRSILKMYHGPVTREVTEIKDTLTVHIKLHGSYREELRA